MSVETGHEWASFLSASGSVGTSSTLLFSGFTYQRWVTIQNTSTNGNTLYLSFNAFATTSDFAIAPGGAITLPYGPAGAAQCVGSAAATKYALIGA